MNLDILLRNFIQENKIEGKGSLCLVLVVTRHAKSKGLPLDPSSQLAKSGGQVFGLGKSSVQKILKDHGILEVLAEEGGRTNRGNVGLMKKYVDFLNSLKKLGDVDLDYIENWWIERVKDHFASEPFVLHYDSSKSLRAILKDLMSQAERKQSQSHGTTFAGTMLQHLVGAKLNLLLDSPPEHHGASVKDEASGREGDFLIEDVAIHVTTTPGEALMRKCKGNLDKSLKPLIITTKKGMVLAEAFAEQAGIDERLDVFEAEQFLAGNLYEIGKFAQSGRKTTAHHLISEYNKIIGECETDPNLRIDASK